MTSAARRFLFWTPRVLTIAFAIFLALFALDVFSEGYTGWRLLLALVMHLKWPATVAAVLVLAWRWEWVGTVLFTLLKNVLLADHGPAFELGLSDIGPTLPHCRPLPRRLA